MKFLIHNTELVREEIEGGVAFSYPKYKEVEADNSDDLGLRYHSFTPTRDVSQAHKLVNQNTAVGIFVSHGNSKEYCGYATYRR